MIFSFSHRDKHIQRFLYKQNMSLYFKMTIIAIFHCMNLNYIYLEYHILTNIFFANKKRLCTFIFQQTFQSI